MQSEDGRILVLQVVIDDMKLILCANIYAPNENFDLRVVNKIPGKCVDA